MRTIGCDSNVRNPSPPLSMITLSDRRRGSTFPKSRVSFSPVSVRQLTQSRQNTIQICAWAGNQARHSTIQQDAQALGQWKSHRSGWPPTNWRTNLNSHTRIYIWAATLLRQRRTMKINIVLRTYLWNFCWLKMTSVLKKVQWYYA